MLSEGFNHGFLLLWKFSQLGIPISECFSEKIKFQEKKDISIDLHYYAEKGYKGDFQLSFFSVFSMQSPSWPLPPLHLPVCSSPVSLKGKRVVFYANTNHVSKA